MSTKARAAVIGVGASDYTKSARTSSLQLAAVALDAALRDAQLSKDCVDGIVVNTGNPRGVDYDVLADQLGLRLRYAMQTWGHGRFVAACLQTAVLACREGLASVIAVIYSSRQSMGNGFGGYNYGEAFTRETGGPHGEIPQQGLTAPVSGAAMALRLYQHRYGASETSLAAVPLTLRAYAERNPKAIFRQPLELKDYLASPMIVEPLRRLDCAPVTDGAVCLLVAVGNEVTRVGVNAVDILGMQGIQAGRDEFVFGRPGLGVQQQRQTAFRPSRWDLAVFGTSGVRSSEIDAFYTYDAFSPLVWFALERFGFCREGEAPSFCEQEIGVGGSLPVNTNGGMLSEGHLCGFNHFLEMVAQLRGRAGERQVSNASLVQWGSCYGDSVILGR
jgi:acetyl-CoA acetyltransferase